MGGRFTFQLTGGSIGTTSNIAWQIWDLDGIDDLITAGAGLTAIHTWATGVDEGDVFVRFYCDSNGNGSLDSGELYVDSEEFWVMKSKVHSITTQVSTAIPSPAVSRRPGETQAAFNTRVLPTIQARLTGAQNLILRKDSANDWRACVTFNVASTGFFIPGAARPDPVTWNTPGEALHYPFADIVFINSYLGGPLATAARDWQKIIAQWTGTGAAMMSVALAHEFGHGVGLGNTPPFHVGYVAGDILWGTAIVGNNRLQKRDVDNYDDGP